MVMHCNITQEVKELTKKLYFVLLFRRETSFYIKFQVNIVPIVYLFLHGCGLHYNVLSGLSIKQEVKGLTTKLHIHVLPRKKTGLLANNWLKLWDMGVKGRMWRVIKKMYEASRSAVFLEGEKSAVFRVWHRVVAYRQYYSPYLLMIC